MSAPAPVTLASSSIIPVAQETPNPASSENPQPEAQETQTAAPSSSAPGFGDQSSFLAGPHLHSAIENMVEMGFPRDQVMKAMRASFNNPDRAVEYLTTVSS